MLTFGQWGWLKESFIFLAIAFYFHVSHLNLQCTVYSILSFLLFLSLISIMLWKIISGLCMISEVYSLWYRWATAIYGCSNIIRFIRNQVLVISDMIEVHPRLRLVNMFFNNICISDGFVHQVSKQRNPLLCCVGEWYLTVWKKLSKTWLTLSKGTANSKIIIISCLGSGCCLGNVLWRTILVY